MPINLDLVPDFGDFVPPISLNTRLTYNFSSKVKESGLKFEEHMLKGLCYHRI